MNPIIYIILAILLIVVLYYLYLYLTSTQVLVKTVNLNETNPATPIPSTHTNFTSNGGSNIQNVRYAYSVWINIDRLTQQTGNPNSTNSMYALFAFGSPSGNAILNPNFIMYMDQSNEAILSVDISCNTGIKKIIINKSFPIQRWTNVIVSIDTNFIDIYQDGKLALSSKINKSNEGNVNVPPSDSSICFGANQGITLGNLMRWPYPIDPTTAYNAYLQGNGQPGASISGIHFNLWSKDGDNSSDKVPLFVI